MADIELSFASGLQTDSFESIANELRACGATVELKRRPAEGPYASLQWLIPTAVVIWVARPYLTEFSKTTGKLHAEALHKGLSSLWKKVFGPNPEVAYRIINSSGKKKESVFTSAVSIKASRNDGGAATHLFPNTTGSADFSLATNQFMKLMQDHYALNGTDGLTMAMPLVEYLNHPNYPALTYMNPESKQLELIDYFESGKAAKLVTHRIPK